MCTHGTPVAVEACLAGVWSEPSTAGCRRHMAVRRLAKQGGGDGKSSFISCVYAPVPALVLPCGDFWHVLVLVPTVDRLHLHALDTLQR